MQRMSIGAALLAVGLAGWLAGTAVAKTKQTSDLDKEFLQLAASGGMAEVQLGQLALDRATSPEVKQFGQRMMADHAAANQELLAVIEAKNLAKPTTLEPKHQQTVEALAKVQGVEFDREYLRHMVANHEETVKLFSKAASAGQDADITAFAAKHLPTMQAHLEMARTLAHKLKVS